MPAISTATLLGVADRAAFEFGLINTAFATINDVGGGLNYTRVTGTDDADVELPLVSPYTSVDNGWSKTNNIKLGTPLSLIITAMESHFKRVGQTPSTWDGYLSLNDKRVSDFFNQVHKAIKGKFMLADNVFSEADDLIASANISAGPAINFVDGINYGNGTSTNLADGTNFAASQLRVKIVGGDIGAADLDIDVIGLDESGGGKTVSVVIPALTAQDAFIDVGGPSDRFRDVTSIIYTPASDEGTDGDAIEIRNKKERTIAL